ncbi:MAG: MmgE/PrpD family protein [Pseudomonadota bacterium]
MSGATQAAPLTTALADYIAGFSPAVLPRAVRERTLAVVRDGTGALIAAANPDYSTGRLIAGFARDQGGTAEASVVGYGFKTSAVMAALANGTMGYACDIEPHHPEGILHPIAVMIPTALALGERVGADGARFLAAVALGCEVEYRVSMALGPAEQYALGFHPSAVCGCFGATAAAAFLLGLDGAATIRALGLAACQASGMMAWESDQTENARPFQMGMAARNGATAALLAASGFGGPSAVFDTATPCLRPSAARHGRNCCCRISAGGSTASWSWRSNPIPACRSCIRRSMRCSGCCASAIWRPTISSI